MFEDIITYVNDKESLFLPLPSVVPRGRREREGGRVRKVEKRERRIEKGGKSNWYKE